MNKKIILCLLLGHTLLAHATPNEPLSLELDSELGYAETNPVTTIYRNDKYDNVEKITLSSHSARTPLRLKLTREGIDESRIGKISEQERTALLRKQKQIYPVKQISRVSNSSKNVDSSMTAGGSNRLQHFAWHSESTPSNPPIAEVSLNKTTERNFNNANAIIEKYPKQTEQNESQQTELAWQIGGAVALGLVLFYLARRMSLRYSSQAKPRVQLALGLSTHQPEFSAESILLVAESLMPPSTKVEISPEVESLVQNEMSLSTRHSYLSVEPALLMEEDWATSTNMVIAPAAKQPHELPPYPTNLIEMSPVVRPMISAVRNSAPPHLPSPLNQTTVEEVEFPEPINLLADFNPTKYESSKAFLESRKALTIEQIIEWSKCVTGNQQSLSMFHKFG